MQKRRRLLIGAAAALTVVALTIAFLLGTFTRSGEAQSPAAGDEAPAIADPPLARIAVAGDTGTGGATARATAVSLLAERAQMTKQSMAELVGHLEAHGYVTRIPDPTDKRAKLVLPTHRGDRHRAAVRAGGRSKNHPPARHRASTCAARGSGHHPANVRSVASVMVDSLMSSRVQPGPSAIVGSPGGRTENDLTGDIDATTLRRGSR